MINTEASQKW